MILCSQSPKELKVSSMPKQTIVIQVHLVRFEASIFPLDTGSDKLQVLLENTSTSTSPFLNKMLA